MPTYSTIYSFGDSLSDAGDAYLLTSSAFGAALGSSPEPVHPPYYQESYGTTTADVFSSGQVWVQDLAYTLGLTNPGPGQVGATGNQLLAAGVNPLAVGFLDGGNANNYITATAGAAGGTDFAIGGSVTGPTGFNTSGTAALTDLQSQILNFQQEYPTPQANALYTVWSGSNDVLNLLADLATVGTSAAQMDVAQSAQNEIDAVTELAGAGAKTILLADVPDLGKIPETTSAGIGAVATAFATLFNQDLAQDLANAAATLVADGAKVVTLDTFGLIDSAVSSVTSSGSLTVPGQNGGTITDVTTPAYTGSFTSNTGTEVATPNTHLFFDMLHPTQTGHQALANLADADLNAACFCIGTHIRTPAGDAAIETLHEGDTVLTASGQARRIKWIGRRSYLGRFLQRSGAMQPVRFAAGSLGDGLPLRDLLVSPDHAMALDGILIPARELVNGMTVTRARQDSVHYIHIELDTHDLLLAEGAPSESFADDEGSRNAFSNAADYWTRFGPEPSRPAQFCLPRASDGALVEAVRQRLLPASAA